MATYLDFELNTVNYLFINQKLDIHFTSVSYCMICAYVRGIIHELKHKPYNNFLIAPIYICTLYIGISMKGAKSLSYCMVCAHVREDNPRSLANGLSPVMLTTIQYLHQYACALCAL